MNRFNLTFSGEILAGEDPEQVKLRFADMFAIDDPVRLDRFFSGETIILRRNLERKDAAQQYHQLQLLGAAAALVKVTTSEMADAIVTTTPPAASASHGTTASVHNASNTSPASSKPALVAKDSLGSADAAAEIKARRLAAQRLAAEKAAQEKAAAEAQQRQLDEQKAREQARAAESLRVQEEERARQAAEQARMEAEEAALREAKRAEEKRLKEEARRKAAEKAAQRKARRIKEKAEKARQKAEESARRQAEAEEKKRIAAEEEARRKAAVEEKKRLEAEEAARHKAELEEKRRIAAEEEARLRAEIAEKKRFAAEEEARLKAEIVEKKRLAAEEEARLNAQLEERKRRAAEEEARRTTELDEERRQSAEKNARRKAALEKKKRLAAEKKARRLAERAEKRRLAAKGEQINAPAQRREETAQQQSAQQRQPQPLSRSELPARNPEPLPVAARAAPRSQKPANRRVKTTLDVPLRKSSQTAEADPAVPRKRQTGAPNLYQLRPFRNSPAVRTRAAHARQTMRRAYSLGAFSLALLLIAGGIFLQNNAHPAITGASAVAVNSNSEPLLLAGDTLLLHDRAGVGTTQIALGSLQVETLQPPLAIDSEDALIALGRLANEPASQAQDDELQLLRCDLARAVCERLAPQLQDSHIDAFVKNPLDGSLLLADSTAGELLKVDSEGAIVATATAALPADPVMRLHGGLLLMNSTAGPAISVFRYEDNAFGKQLDEILLLPPSMLPLEESRVSAFIWSGSAWWVHLRDPASGRGELHRFDADWNYLNTVPLTSHSGPLQLIRWGQKTLVNAPRQAAIQRFNDQGTAEAPFVSNPLQALISGQQQQGRLARLAWNGGLLLCALAALLSFTTGYLHGLRSLVYRSRREQGAEPVDEHAAALHWIEPVQNRQLQLRRTGMLYGLGVLGLLLLGFALGISVWQMAALLLALSGPAIALLLLSRQPVGHIGVLGDRVLLVDHSGHYHLAGGPRLHYCGPFLLIDDIVVFSGSRLLPAFSPAPLHQYIRPPAMGGIKVDYKTITVKLLECRHPLALGIVAIVAAAAAAALLLLLQRIF